MNWISKHFSLSRANSKLEELNRRIDQLDRKEVESLAAVQLAQSFTFSNFIPSTNWSISASTILHILNEIIINRRNTIIEFGAGLSTLYIAALAKKNNIPLTLVSVDHSPEWVQIVKETLSKEGLDGIVHFVTTDLENNRFCTERSCHWYQPEGILRNLSQQQFDLVIVDGPPAGKAPIRLSRYGALPFLMENNLLHPAVAVILDDTTREGENEIAERWCKEFKFKKQKLNGHSILFKEERFSTIPLCFR